MGLGFGFQAKDQGLLAFQKKANAGFLGMGDSLSTLTSMASRFSAQGMNLTTSLEQFSHSQDISARKIIANAGFMGKEFDALRKESVSLSESLNLSGQATADAAVAMKRSQKIFRSLGVDTAQLVKFQELTGASAQRVGEGFGRLAKELEINTTEELKQFEKALISSGAATRDIGGQVDFLRRATAKMSREHALGSKETAKYGLSILKASAGFMAFVDNAQEARSLAETLTESLISNREHMHGLMAGTKKDIGPLVKELAVANQDITKSFDMISKGPAEFVESLVNIGAEAQEQGKLTGQSLQFIRARLESATDPKTAGVLINIMQKGREGAEKFSKSLEGMPQSIAQVAKHFKTDRTPQQWADFYEEQLVRRFRRITGGTGKFLKGLRKETKRTGDVIEGMVERGGPWGQFLERSSELHKFGVTALLPEALRPTASAFGMMAKSVMGSLGPVSSLLREGMSLASVFKLVAGGIAAVSFLLEVNRGDVQKTSDQIASFVETGLGKLEKFVNQDGPKLFQTFSATFDKVQAVISRTWKRLWPTLEPILQSFREKLVFFTGDLIEGVKAGFGVVEAKKPDGLAGSIGNFLGAGFKEAVRLAKKFLPPAIEFFIEAALDAIGIVLAKNKTYARIFGAMFGFKEFGVTGALGGAFLVQDLISRGEEALDKREVTNMVAKSTLKRHTPNFSYTIPASGATAPTTPISAKPKSVGSFQPEPGSGRDAATGDEQVAELKRANEQREKTNVLLKGIGDLMKTGNGDNRAGTVPPSGNNLHNSRTGVSPSGVPLVSR